MKVSLHTQAGGVAAAHNDGSLYVIDDAEHKAGRQGGVMHWDMYTSDGPATDVDRYTDDSQGRTVEALRRLDDDVIRPQWERRCATTWKKKPKARKTWDAYRRRTHDAEVRESILQVGSMKDKEAGTDVAGILHDVLPDYITRLEAQGATVIAVDIHDDEDGATHAHIVHAYIDDRGEFNMNRVLEAHGVERAAPARRRSKKGKLESDASYARRCSRIARATSDLRTVAEDAADKVLAARGLPPVDRDRDPDAQHTDVATFRARQDAIADRDKAAQELEAAQAAKADALRAAMDAAKDRDAARREREDAAAERTSARYEREDAETDREAARDARAEALRRVTDAQTYAARTRADADRAAADGADPVDMVHVALSALADVVPPALAALVTRIRDWFDRMDDADADRVRARFAYHVDDPVRDAAAEAARADERINDRDDDLTGPDIDDIWYRMGAADAVPDAPADGHGVDYGRW